MDSLRAVANRASTETITSDVASLSEAMTSSGKRQPRKLTKSRNPSEMTPERPKGVLKKTLSRQGGGMLDNGDAEGGEAHAQSSS